MIPQMALNMACVVFESGTVTDEALSRGFAVASAGFDLDTAKLTLGEIAGLPGFNVAFYSSGRKHEAFLEVDHVAELFEEELPPAMAVFDHAKRAAGPKPAKRVFSLVYAEEAVLDDACVFDAEGFRRSFVREGDDGPIAGTIQNEEAEETALTDEEVDEHEARGSAFLSRELRANVLVALSQALFMADRVVRVSLAGSDAAAVDDATRALVTSLRRTVGRGAPAAEELASIPAIVRPFASAYDWADPSDPSDIYRELSIGKLVGNAHFTRPTELREEGGRVMILTLSKGGLGAARTTSPVFLDLATSLLVDEAAKPLGPTWCELLTYLALGYKTRDDVEEDWIQALMLRAAVRSS